MSFNPSQPVNTRDPVLFVFDSHAKPGICRCFIHFEELFHLVGAFGQNLKRMLRRLLHYIENLPDIGGRDLLMKQVAHRIYKVDGWPFPLYWISQALREEG